MLVNPKPILLASARDVNTHLDRWTEEHLTDPAQWQAVLDLSRDWSDYSARNQLLLASYSATGPVAGIETWRLVPARDTGNCAVRSGEHAFPVRVPVTTTANEPDPHLGGVRPTAAAVQGWEWRGVFCLEQLARRPDPVTLARLDHTTLVDASGLRDAAVATARRTLKGRTPDLDDPTAVLTAAAGRMPRSSTRAAPTGALAEQAAWLALSRVGRADGPPPVFDPGGLAVRERWESMLDVLDTDRRLSAALGRHLGVDLLASPLPRMEVVDDRAVAATRRNRLPRASLQQLPVGRWVEVGPYTHDEWGARGEDAAGRGTYLRLNSTAYLVAVERGDRATWRLEDTRAKVGAGRLDGGDEPSLDSAKATALATLTRRYPQLAGFARDVAAPAPSGTRPEWEPVPDRPGTLRRVHHGHVVTYVIPAGEQWVPMLQRTPGGLLEAIGAPADSREEAISMSDLGGRRAVREAQLETRVGLDDAIADLAGSADYNRGELIQRVSTRLNAPEQAMLASDPTPGELVELLGAAGVTPATTVAVLHAEGTPAVEVGPLLAIVGIPPADAIGELHQRWGIGRVDAAELVSATAIEMRAAGCTPTEIIAARPREVVTSLPARPDLWDLAGGTLAVTGHTPEEIAGIVATHAPNADCFAAALTAAVDEPHAGLALAVRRGMPSEAIVALSERYGLAPIETATALAEASASPRLAVQVIYDRCDADPVLTTQIARSALGLRTEAVIAALGDHDPVDAATVSHLHAAAPLSRDRDALIEAHQPPRPAPRPPLVQSEAARLLVSLPDPAREDGVSGRTALLAALPEPDVVAPDLGLLASLPEPDLTLDLTEIDR
jgi:hypothetical protein